MGKQEAQISENFGGDWNGGGNKRQTQLRSLRRLEWRRK
jgi:hypothetical protein